MEKMLICDCYLPEIDLSLGHTFLLSLYRRSDYQASFCFSFLFALKLLPLLGKIKAGQSIVTVHTASRSSPMASLASTPSL